MKFAQLIEFVFAQPAVRTIDHSSWVMCITGDLVAQEVHGDRNSYQFLQSLQDLLYDMSFRLGVKYGSLNDEAPEQDTVTLCDVLNLAGSRSIVLDEYPDVQVIVEQYDLSTYGGMQQVFERFNHFPQEVQ